MPSDGLKGSILRESKTYSVAAIVAASLAVFLVAAFIHTDDQSTRTDAYSLRPTVAFHIEQEAPPAPCIGAFTNALSPGCLEQIEQEHQAWLNSQSALQVESYSPAESPSSSGLQGAGVSYEASYIYSCESGSCGSLGTYSTTVWNSEGCYGIGQSCPGGPLFDSCGADFACQHAFFTNYANERYGGWQGAYQWWLSHHWW